MSPTVDILITSYRQPEYLDQCLQSVAAQTWRNFKVYVVDDSPGNPVQPVIEKWRAQGLEIDFTQNPVNLGALRSLHNLYVSSSSEYVMWLNHDDVLYPTLLERLVPQGLERQPECSLAYALYNRLMDGQRLPDTGVYRPQFPTGAHDVLPCLCVSNWIISSFAVMRRQTCDDVGAIGRHVHRHLQAGGTAGGYIDLYLFMRLATRGQAWVVNEALGDYRIHSDNNTSAVGAESRRTGESIRTYDFVFDDHDLFGAIPRYLSKANSIGRLMTDLGIIQVLLHMLQSSELGKELRPQAKELLMAAHEALHPFIYDVAQLNRPAVFPEAHLQELRKLIQSL